MTTPPVSKTGVSLISEERRRHVEHHGYTASHDRNHQDSELTAASICYAVASDGPTLDPTSDLALIMWPWDLDEFRADDDPLRNLVKAGALIAAEIDRRLLAGEISGAEERQQQAEEAEIAVLPLGAPVPMDVDHVHSLEGDCIRDRGGKCTAPSAPPIPVPDVQASPLETCPKCGHRAHGSWCLNLASDNDCACTHVTVSALGKVQH